MQTSESLCCCYMPRRASSYRKENVIVVGISCAKYSFLKLPEEPLHEVLPIGTFSIQTLHLCSFKSNGNAPAEHKFMEGLYGMFSLKPSKTGLWMAFHGSYEGWDVYQVLKVLWAESFTVCHRFREKLMFHVLSTNQENVVTFDQLVLLLLKEVFDDFICQCVMLVRAYVHIPTHSSLPQATCKYNL